MDILPNELVEYTTTYLDSASLYNFSQTCHRYNYSNELKNRLKIDWTNPQNVIESLLNAVKCHDTILVQYIFKRIEALLYIESDSITANMVIIYKDDLLKLDPSLKNRLDKLDKDTATVDLLVYLNMFT